jgi:hypothetical protein
VPGVRRQHGPLRCCCRAQCKAGRASTSCANASRCWSSPRCSPHAPRRMVRVAANRVGAGSRLQRVAKLIEPLAAVRPVTIVSDTHEGDRMRSDFRRLGHQVSIEPPSGRRKLEQFIGTRQRFAEGSLRCWRHPLLVDLSCSGRMAGERLVLPSKGSSHSDLAAALCQGVFAFRHSQAAASPWANRRVARPVLRSPRGRRCPAASKRRRLLGDDRHWARVLRPYVLISASSS